MLKYLRAIAIWLLPPLAVVALPTEAPELTCLAMIYAYLGGLILAFAFLIIFFATRSKPPAATALILVVTIWLLVWNYGFTAGARIHLLVNERRYLTAIREFDKKIVTFHYCHCFLNWPDIVYDPNDNLDVLTRDELQKFDPYLHGSKRLSKNWYIGYFGD
jgi:hypothetical protein